MQPISWNPCPADASPLSQSIANTDAQYPPKKSFWDTIKGRAEELNDYAPYDDTQWEQGQDMGRIDLTAERRESLTAPHVGSLPGYVGSEGEQHDYSDMTQWEDAELSQAERQIQVNSLAKLTPIEKLVWLAIGACVVLLAFRNLPGIREWDWR
jgi:hypothetical protein